jgi:hypothetical protein
MALPAFARTTLSAPASTAALVTKAASLQELAAKPTAGLPAKLPPVPPARSPVLPRAMVPPKPGPPVMPFFGRAQASTHSPLHPARLEHHATPVHSGKTDHHEQKHHPHSHHKQAGQPNRPLMPAAPKLAPLAPGVGHGLVGQPLAPHIQQAIEHSFLVDLSNVRIHLSPTARKNAAALSARAFAYGSDIFLGPGEHPHDLGLMAHEAAHVVQQQGGSSIQAWSGKRSNRFENEADSASSAVLRGEPFQIRERVSGPQVQRLGIADALNYFADAAYNIPGYRMFTLIIGINPINMQPVDRSPGNVLRALVEFLPGGHLITQGLDKYGIIDKVGGWMQQQLDTLAITGTSIRQALDTFLDSLKWSDIFHLGSVWERAKAIFTDPIQRIKSFVVGLVEGIWKFVRDAILKPLAELASKTAGWDLLCAVLGTNPITGEAVPRTAETLIGGFMKLIHEDEVWANIKKANAIPRAWAWFQGALSGLMGFVRQIPALFLSTLHSLEWSDIINLPAGFRKVAGAFGSFLGSFVTWAGDTVWTLLQLIFEVVAPAVMPYLKKVGAAFKKILKDPISFMRNLIAAGKLGFVNFGSNFLTHLKAGLIDWLTGSLPGVYIPKAISLPEIGQFAMSVLGITWAQIRGKIVKALGPNGEKIMVALENTFDVVVALVKGGPAAAWELIKEKLTNLQDMVIGGITSFVIDTIVKKAIPKLIAMFVPGAGFVSAIISIYDTIMVFVEKLTKIMAAVKAFVDSIVSIANGQLETAAKRVETTLGGLLSLAISFLAGFLGLGNITSKVLGVIEKIRAAVDKAIDTAITWVVTKAKALFAKLFGKDKKDDRTDEQKQMAVQNALAEADALLSVPEPDIDKVQNRLPAIKNKHKVAVLELKVDTTDTEEETVHLHGENSPGKDTPARKVPRGGPNTVITVEQLEFGRPKWRAYTKKELRRLHASMKNVMNADGSFKSPTKWHRRHVVAWADILRHYQTVFGNKKVKDAAAILAKENKPVDKVERRVVVQAIKGLARDAFNEADNLFIGLGKENSALQDALDDAHPDFLNDLNVKDMQKIDTKVANFIASHAIGGYTFSVSVADGLTIDWDVEYVK